MRPRPKRIGEDRLRDFLSLAGRSTRTKWMLPGQPAVFEFFPLTSPAQFMRDRTLLIFPPLEGGSG